MHKRRRSTKMVALTIAILVSPNATTKGGGPHVLLFLIYAFPFEYFQIEKASSQQSFIVVPCHFT